LPHGPFTTERAVRAFCKRQGWPIDETPERTEPSALERFRDRVLAEIASEVQS
jgi:hypothetical protein